MMHTRTTRFAAALALFAGILAACATDPDQPTSPTPSHSEHYNSGEPGPVAATSPVGVFTSAVTTIFSWQPATDASPTDALRRARADLTGEALASANSSATVRPSAQWQSWARAQDVVLARVDKVSAVTVTADRAVGRGTVVQTVLGVDAAITPYRTFDATADLIRVDGTWKLATYPRTDVGTGTN